MKKYLHNQSHMNDLQNRDKRILFFIYYGLIAFHDDRILFISIDYSISDLYWSHGYNFYYI